MKSSQGQLVCQHLENISRKALENYQKIIKDFVKGRHGVYALYKKGRLYYVGLASNLRNRLRSHLKDRHAKTWDTFSVYLAIKDSHLSELETLILKIASPKGNKISGKFIKSQNLKPRFKKCISTAQHIELDSLLGNKKEQHIKSRGIKRIDGRIPVLAEYVTKRFRIRFRFKGKLHKATVRKNGTISYKGNIYLSPSLAGHAVMGHTANGWKVWQYERAPGDWVILDNLRKK